MAAYLAILVFTGGCDDPDGDGVAELADGFSELDDLQAVDDGVDQPGAHGPLQLSWGDGPEHYMCPPSPEPCGGPELPNCAIQDIKLVAFQNNSTCAYGADVNVLWSVKAPNGILGGTGVLGVKTANSTLYYNDSIPIVITPKGGGTYEISHSYMANVSGLAYNGSTTWISGLRLTTNCPGIYKNANVETNFPIAKNLSSPCSRNDKVYINPPLPASLTGVHAVGACNNPTYKWPTHHKVDVYDVTGGGKTLVNSELVPFMGVNLLPNLEFGKKYRFEYRNAVFSNNIQTCATSTPFVETWQF